MRLNGKIMLGGLGLHSGKECELIIEPCKASEILMNGQPLRSLRFSGTNRGSDYIFDEDTKIRTCEHVLSALTGLGIWSGVNVRVNGGEMPALDGCGKLLSDEILKHRSNDNYVEATEVSKPVIVNSDNRKRFVAAFPADRLHITYTVEYEFIGTQVFDYDHSPENYYENIASARTFAMLSDIEYLKTAPTAIRCAFSERTSTFTISELSTKATSKQTRSAVVSFFRLIISRIVTSCPAMKSK